MDEKEQPEASDAGITKPLELEDQVAHVGGNTSASAAKTNAQEDNTVVLADQQASSDTVPIKDAEKTSAFDDEEVSPGPNDKAKASAADAAAGSSESSETQAIDLDAYADDPVALKRIAHGLPPKPSNASPNDIDAGVATEQQAENQLDRLENRAFSKERRAQKDAEDRARKLKHQKRMRLARRIIAMIVLLLVAALIVAFCILRWGIINDRAAIQGTWKMEGVDATVTITDERILLTEDVAYEYVLDPESKTFVFTFGGLTGQGRYRFSLDGNQLALEDGEFDWLSTLGADIPWTVQAVTSQLAGNPPASPALGTGSMLLERVR